VIAFHEQLIDTIAAHESDKAGAMMEAMLVRGEKQLLENM
jgi:DNA-binding FadR family transcriptional regulator